MTALRLLITLAAGCIGGSLALKAKMPAGALVGAMVFAAAWNLFTNTAYIPWYFKPCAQSVAGAFIALPLTRAQVKNLRGLLKPAAVVVAGMLLFSIGSGYLCRSSTAGQVTLISGFLMSSPGGMTDIVLMAGDLGADTLQVSVVHLIRNFTNLLVFPLLDGLCLRLLIRKKPEVFAARCGEASGEYYGAVHSFDWMNLFLSLALALACGWLGYFTGLPAGALLFSLVGFAAFNITTQRGCIPISLRRFTQMCTGTLVGSAITRESLAGLRHLIFPILIVVLVNLVMNWTLGAILYFYTPLDLHTSFIATIPGAAADMAMIAEDLEGDGLKVALIQIIRFISVVMIYPQVYRLLAALSTA